jgi:hypothetical protein
VNNTVLPRPALEIQMDLQHVLAKLQAIENILARIQRGDSGTTKVAADALAMILSATAVVVRLEDEVISAVKIG